MIKQLDSPQWAFLSIICGSVANSQPQYPCNNSLRGVGCGGTSKHVGGGGVERGACPNFEFHWPQVHA